MIKRYAGVTLLEVMLVLVIGASLIYFSLMQYRSYRRDADAVQVQANVNAIFQAMSGYYRQNCDRNPSSYTQPPGEVGHTALGTLNPSAGITTPFGINIQTDLRDNGFLTTNFPLYNPLVNNSAGTNGYLAQFNLGTPSTQRQICDTGTGPTPITCTNTIDIGAITTWMAQVAVQINNPTNDPNVALAYLKILGGDCLSTASGNLVTPCVADSTGSGNFVVWARLPSNANTEAKSDLWTIMPTINQFKQLYTTYPILDLTNQTSTGNQNYLCGN